MVEKGTYRVKSGLAEMLKGGVIMDVTTAEQARIAEEAGAVAVMALERVPADIRAQGGVARMADPSKVREIHEGGVDPGDGQGAHRPLRRGAGPAGARGRLHRRVGGPDPGRPRVPHQQVGVHRSVRVRRARPRRGVPPDRRRRGDDPHEGRAGHRQRHRGRAPHAAHERADPRRARRPRGRADDDRQGARGAALDPACDPRRRAPAGRQLRRRRHRHAGRRGDDDAARLRRDLRRQRHLQVRRPGGPGAGDRRRRRRTTRTRTSSPASPRTSARRWPGSRSRRSPSTRRCRRAADEGRSPRRSRARCASTCALSSGSESRRAS